MSYKILPPKSWLYSEKKNQKVNLYNEIFEKYEDNETIFKVIKKDGNIKLLNKIDCKKYIEYFFDLH